MAFDLHKAAFFTAAETFKTKPDTILSFTPDVLTLLFFSFFFFPYESKKVTFQIFPLLFH